MKHQKYIGVYDTHAGPVEIFHCDSDEDAKRMVEEFLFDHPHVDEVAFYELKQIARRQASVQWTYREDPVLKIPEKLGGPYQPWTDDENLYLLKARKVGFSYGRIAEHLGRTPHAVEVQASRLRCG